MQIKVYQAELSNTEIDLSYTTILYSTLEELNKAIEDIINKHYRTYSLIERYEITIDITNNKKSINYYSIDKNGKYIICDIGV